MMVQETQEGEMGVELCFKNDIFSQSKTTTTTNTEQNDKKT